MKIVDGQNAVMGRVASYAAKEALKGEDVIVLNCKEMIISGTKKFTEKNLHEKKGRVGSSQHGPKYSLTSEKIVKTAIRGMLPNYRLGRGKVAFQRIKCYEGVPKEFETAKKIVVAREKKKVFSKVREVSK